MTIPTVTRPWKLLLLTVVVVGAAGSAAAASAATPEHRAASWLLDGVRQGQDLGDLLGYQFERGLHDLHADDQIRPVRQLVLRLTGNPEVPPDEPLRGTSGPLPPWEPGDGGDLLLG